MTLFSELKKFRQPYFIYLLRADLRENLPIGNPSGIEFFIKWWDRSGEKEYGKDRQGTSLIRMMNWETVPLEQNGFCHQVPRIWQNLWLSRSDLQAKFPLNNSDFTKDFERWYLIHGVDEVEDSSLFSEEMKQRFLEPFWQEEGFEDLKPQSAKNQEFPFLTRFALYYWREIEDLRERFDLTKKQDRAAYLAWSLVDGVKENPCHRFIVQLFSEIALESRGKKTGIPAISVSSTLASAAGAAGSSSHDLFPQAGPETLQDWFLAKAIASQPQSEESNCESRWPARIRPFHSDPAKQDLIGVNLIGHARGEIGIGEDVRTLALALEKQGIPVQVVDIPLSDGIRQSDRSVEHLISEKSTYSTNIFCMTGFETARLYAEQGSAVFDGYYNIGYWPWELAKWPDYWAPAFDLVDEVWASSSFIQRAYQGETDKPVRRLSLAVSVDGMTVLSRDELGLPSAPFLFLFVFDFNSYLSRKNPLGVLEAFQRAFPLFENSDGDPSKQSPVGLVFKVMNAPEGNGAWQHFMDRCAEDDRITVLQDTMDKKDVLGLINACDALVSLHRSEGFGRTLAEALLLGKDVIATDYSGNQDFMTCENSYPVDYSLTLLAEGDYFFGRGQDWATANPEKAAVAMRSSFDNRNKPSKSLRSLEKDGNPFSLDLVGEQAVALLRQNPNFLPEL